MSRSGGRRRNNPQVEEQELATKTLQIQNKRFYLDVKQNDRGRFIKITEVSLNGKKFRILMSVPAAYEFREKLEELIKGLQDLPKHNANSIKEDGILISMIILRDNRRYYLDLRENERGRFLRLSMLTMGRRTNITVPVDGITTLRDGIDELITNHCGDIDLNAPSDLPESKLLHVSNKTFYFDVGNNHFGVFLRISEVRTAFRTAITIPESHWDRFRNVLNEVVNSRPARTENGVEDNEEPEAAVRNSSSSTSNLNEPSVTPVQ